MSYTEIPEVIHSFNDSCLWAFSVLSIEYLSYIFIGSPTWEAHLYKVEYIALYFLASCAADVDIRVLPVRRPCTRL